MSDSKDNKPTPAADSVAEDTAMERKLLALKKAVTDLFTPTNPHHIGVEHYDLQHRNFLQKILSFGDDCQHAVNLIRTELNGLSTTEIDNQTPTIDKLRYGQSLLEVIDCKQAEDEAVRLPQANKSHTKPTKAR